MLISPLQSELITKNYAQNHEIQNLIHQQNGIVKNQSLKSVDNLEGLFICHATKFFPTNGVIAPRMKFLLPEHRNNQGYTGLKKIIESAFSILRPTVHFAINSLLSEHKDFHTDHTDSIVIVDSGPEAMKQMIGGYGEDIFCLGPYEISRAAQIFVPQSMKQDKDLQKKIATVSDKIEIEYYKGTAKAAVEGWALKNKKPLFVPIQNNPNIPNFFHKIGNNQYFSSQTIMQKLGKTFCSHDITPTAQLEGLVAQSPVKTVSPFLDLFLDKDYRKKMSEYFDATKKVYSLSDTQKEYFDKYQRALSSTLDLIRTSTNIKNLISNFDFERERLIEFDAKVDLNRPISEQSTVEKLSEITGLKFTPYFRNKCELVVDAAVQIHSDDIKSKFKDLKEQFNLNFIIEMQGDISYIVLKEVNTTDIAEEVSKLYLSIVPPKGSVLLLK